MILQFSIWPYRKTALFLLHLVYHTRYLSPRSAVDPHPDIPRAEILPECSMLISALAVWHAIIHSVCSGGILPNCKLA